MPKLLLTNWIAPANASSLLSRLVRLKGAWSVLLGALVIAPSLIAPSLVQANALPDRQDLLEITQKVQEFLLTQSQGAPGVVSVTVVPLDSRMKLAACPNVETFLPSGSRAWGKTAVAVRCSAPSTWTIYVQATVSVMADYLAAAKPLAQGHVLSQQDVMFLKGDLTTLPAGIFTDISQVVGRSASVSLGASAVLKQEMLRSPVAVQQGQTVHLVTSGDGFSVSVEGYALASASDGQTVQARTPNGQVISGIARNGGQVDVSF